MTPEKEKDPAVIDVKITNKDKSERDTTYDSRDADDYEEHKMSQKEIEEFENGNP